MKGTFLADYSLASTCIRPGHLTVLRLDTRPGLDSVHNYELHEFSRSLCMPSWSIVRHRVTDVSALPLDFVKFCDLVV